jgi:predicted transposase YbfD/YdcC
MSKKNSNGIINTLSVISEQIKQLHFSEDDIISIVDSQMFLHIFSNVPDFRQEGKVVYKLHKLLMMIFLAIAQQGKISFVGIEDYIEARKKMFEKYGLIENGQCPKHDTIRRVLSLLSSDALQKATIDSFYNFLKYLERHIRKQGDHIHIGYDGKDFKGSGRNKNSNNPRSNIGMLNVYEDSVGTCILTAPIDIKDSEIPTLQGLIPSFNLKDTISTADAIHCQKETVKLIHDAKGKFVIAVKKNQKSLYEEIEARFNNPKSKIKTYYEENRVIEILKLPSKYTLADEWKGLKTFVRMHSDTHKGVHCEMYFISNTSDERLIIDGILNRWIIENKLHRHKDLDLREDDWRSQDKNTLHNIAIINNLVLQLFRMYATLSNKEFRKAKVYFQFNPIEALNYILAVMSSEEIVSDLIDSLQKYKKNRA